MVYNEIFFSNILRILDERGMSKNTLSEMTGVSISFLSDLTNGKANPSLRVMEAIADALQTPLSVLLENTDLDSEALRGLAPDKPLASLPPGYVRVSGILPEHQAFIVRKWFEQAKKRTEK